MPGAEPAPDARTLLRSSAYVKLLVLAALIGVPVSAAAYGFLKLVDWLETELWKDLPSALGFQSPPVWWPLPLLAIGGATTAAAIRFLPGTGGHSPADGLKTGGPCSARSCCSRRPGSAARCSCSCCCPACSPRASAP